MVLSKSFSDKYYAQRNTLTHIYYTNNACMHAVRAEEKIISMFATKKEVFFSYTAKNEQPVLT